MKINLKTQKEKKKFSFNMGWKRFRELAAESDPGFRLDSVEVEGELERAQGNWILRGNFKADLQVDCCRCLEEARLPIGADFRYILLPAVPEDPEREELSGDDMDVVFCEDDLFDLDPIVYEQVMLQAPMKPLCRDECGGLCPRCGVNLNIDSCLCPAETWNTAFSVLKSMKANK